MRWKKLEFISQNTYKNLYCSDSILPKALPKVHKQDIVHFASLFHPFIDLCII